MSTNLHTVARRDPLHPVNQDLADALRAYLRAQEKERTALLALDLAHLAKLDAQQNLAAARKRALAAFAH